MSLVLKGTRLTIRVSDDEYDLALKPEAAVERGFWRRVFWLHPDHAYYAEGYEPGVVARFHGDEWMFLVPHKTEAEADYFGRHLDEYARQRGVADLMRYVRAEFFPNYAGGAS